MTMMNTGRDDDKSTHLVENKSYRVGLRFIGGFCSWFSCDVIELSSNESSIDGLVQ